MPCLVHKEEYSRPLGNGLWHKWETDMVFSTQQKHTGKQIDSKYLFEIFNIRENQGSNQLYN